MDRVHAAAIEELAESGYGGLTIPNVAAKAGANKTSVYRRWHSKGELVRSALESALLAKPRDPGSAIGEADSPPGADLRARIIAMLKDSAAVAGTIAGRGAILALLSNARSEEVAGIAKALLSGPAAEGPKAILAEAERKGELTASLDPSLVLTVLSGAILQRTVVEGLDAGDAFLEGLVDLVLTGIRADRP